MGMFKAGRGLHELEGAQTDYLRNVRKYQKRIKKAAAKAGADTSAWGVVWEGEAMARGGGDESVTVFLGFRPLGDIAWDDLERVLERLQSLSGAGASAKCWARIVHREPGGQFPEWGVQVTC